MIIFLDITTGLRRGEVMGLEWKDINCESGIIKVTRQSEYTKEAGIFEDSLKTSGSEREIQSTPELLAMLKEYKKWQAEERMKIADPWKDHDRLFTKWNGEPMHPDTISKWFPEFRRKYNLSDVPFHGLRHTAATMLLNGGLNLKALASMLGHVDGTMVLKTYGHTTKGAKKEAADIMERQLNKSKNQLKVEKK